MWYNYTVVLQYITENDTMVNECLLPNVYNGVHHESCFCVCREVKLRAYLSDDGGFVCTLRGRITTLYKNTSIRVGLFSATSSTFPSPLPLMTER